MKKNDEQLEYWNNAGGERWVAHQEVLDAMVRPFGEAALTRLALRAGEHVLDVGCGCGETLLSLAKAVGPSGSVTGIDPSEAMLARAGERIATATLIVGDASNHAFAQRFDAIYSRFGVMFFADPVAAFAHLRASLAPAGRLGFVCWRGPEENLWASLPAATVRESLPELALPAPAELHAPGPFAFAAPERIREVLGAAGFSAIEVAPFDCEVLLSTQGAADAAHFALTAGPASWLLAAATQEQRDRAADALTTALAPHVDGGRVALRGGAFTVLARV